MTGPFIGTAEKKSIQALKERAEKDQVDILEVIELLKTEEGRQKHMRRMESLSLALREEFIVTYSVELNQPMGKCRHLSVSQWNGEKPPALVIVQSIMQEFDFAGPGTSTAASIYLEKFRERGYAVNVIQAYYTSFKERHDN